ncbi:toll-like receptor 2 type-1 [Saccostrea echinata]|uniref:toll-like receptor 2 type-1 n=1 Tax=Saccostrea echinata TaxID=191078 RepID=UPI002A81FD1F|nr:toll-like receptor 2 type-1 [Saccostrea echinata]
MNTLEELNFTDNIFEKLHNFCLNKTEYRIPAFPKLQKLHMAVNDLMDTSDFLQQRFCLQQVRFLNISDNLFQKLTLFAFYGMIYLQTLIIDDLCAVVMDNTSLSSTSLQTLSIGRIVERKDKEFRNIFLNCPNIKVLQIRNTDFSTTDVRKMLEPLKSLSSLTIVYGGIQQMTFLNDFTNLTYIDYSFNRIKEISGNFFQNLTKLNQFILQSNGLNNINQTFLPDFLWKKKNFLLDVSSNPFDCGCQLEWFRVWVENNKDRVIGYPNKYICESPLELKGRSLSEFDPASICHKINPYIILASISCGLLSILIFTTSLLRKFRWDIRYYIYICRNRKPMGYKRFTDDEEYLYDAFIAYNTNDRKWIMSELVRMLERNHKYKLCLHERDIIPGGVYVDDILESIDTSRKLILVLSDNFMDDQWCKYETALASHTLADGDGHKLFLILLGDIRSEHINSSLKVLLNSTSHARWPEKKTDQRIFWQTVKQFMDNN